VKLKYFVVKEVQKQRVTVEHINTNLMIINLLENGLWPNAFIKHAKKMGIIANKDC